MERPASQFSIRRPNAKTSPSPTMSPFHATAGRFLKVKGAGPPGLAPADNDPYPKKMDPMNEEKNFYFMSKAMRPKTGKKIFKIHSAHAIPRKGSFGKECWCFKEFNINLQCGTRSPGDYRDANWRWRRWMRFIYALEQHHTGIQGLEQVVRPQR